MVTWSRHHEAADKVSTRPFYFCSHCIYPAVISSTLEICVVIPEEPHKYKSSQLQRAPHTLTDHIDVRSPTPNSEGLSSDDVTRLKTVRYTLLRLNCRTESSI